MSHHQPRLLLLLLAVAATTTLCLPGRAAAATNNRAIRVAGGVERPPLSPTERADLKARYRRALNRELGLLRALEQLDRGAIMADKRLAKLSAERAAASDNLHAAESQRAAAERRLAEMRKAVRARLRAVLRLRKVPALRFMLSAHDFAESVTKDRLLGKLVRDDRARLAHYRAQLKRVVMATDKRNAELARIDKLNRAVHDEKAHIEQQRRDKIALIAQIERDPTYNERARRDLDAADRALVEKIETLKGWRERRYTFSRVKHKLMPPVTRSYIEVPFGPRRHPSFGTITWHRGVDFRPRSQQPEMVRAVFWARVAFVGWLTGYGTTVILDHGKGWHTVYSHVEDVVVKEGDILRTRQAIATVGSSGSLKGRYLYFEVRHNGQAQNPRHWLR